MAPATKALVPTLIKRQDPPQYQNPRNRQQQATPAPKSTPVASTAPKTARAPLEAPKPAPRDWAKVAGTAQQADAGEWKTVQHSKKATPAKAAYRPTTPLTKPISTRNKEERRLIFRRSRPAETARSNPQDILLEINRALEKAGLPGFIRAVDSGYAASGHLTVLLKEGAPSSMLVPVYNDMLIATVRRVDSAVILVESSEQWQRVKVHGVPVQRYMNSANGLELAREEIELETDLRLKREPTWLKSPKKIRAGRQRFAAIVVTVGSIEDARKLLKSGLRFGGHHYKTEAYRDIKPETVCARCCGIGHSSYLECKNDPPRCAICAGDHEALSHTCNVIGCSVGMGKPCQHSQVKCANCGGTHEATSMKCPKVKQARKHAIQQARNRTQKHRIPEGQAFAIVVPDPQPPLERQSSQGTLGDGTEAGEALSNMEDILTAPTTAPGSSMEVEV